ncbi:MAG: FtsB family cell division protein [Candidatus Dormibacterales bacterium]
MNSRWSFPRRVALFAVLVTGIGWSLYSFGQEALVGYRLNHQASQLRAQNALLQEHNAGYRRDIAALGSSAGAEEQARLNGYARRGEQVYLVGQPPAVSAPPTPKKGKAAHPKPGASGTAGAGGGVDAVTAFRRWVGDHWHG